MKIIEEKLKEFYDYMGYDSDTYCPEYLKKMFEEIAQQAKKEENEKLFLSLTERFPLTFDEATGDLKIKD